MCVICCAAKKRHMKREEVLAAIRHNDSGFFGFTVHDGARRTIRTLDDRQFVKFFDEVVEDDDMWVMHARIPSKGAKSLDNVHGWEEDGIIFCHNMTITSIDGMMRSAKWENTDSEFFFRHIFMPFYRGCGEKAYEDGKFCQDLDNIVRHFCGTTNRFLFIMPDNRLVRYGDWITEKDRLEGGEPAFWASNSTYKAYTQAWPPAGKGGDGKTVGFRAYEDDVDDDLEGYAGCYSSFGGCTPPWRKDRDEEAYVELVTDGIAGKDLVKIALCDLVSRGAVAFRALPVGDTPDLAVTDLVTDSGNELIPSCFSDGTYDTVATGLEELAAGKGYKVSDFLRDYAREFAEPFIRYANCGQLPYWPRKSLVDEGLKRFDADWMAFKMLLNLEVDWTATDPDSLAVMVSLEKDPKKGWTVQRVGAEDILVDRCSAPDAALGGVQALLDYIADRKPAKKGGGK